MNDDPSEVDVLYAKVIHPVLLKFFPFFKVILHRLCLTTESLLTRKSKKVRYLLYISWSHRFLRKFTASLIIKHMSNEPYHSDIILIHFSRAGHHVPMSHHHRLETELDLPKFIWALCAQRIG
jgi:hypothetical protein